MKPKRRLVGFARGLAALLIMLATNVSTARSLQAATLNVASCEANDLISAVASANSDSAADTVNLAPGCTYTLTTGGFSADGQNGLPDIISPMTINGNGATIARDIAVGTPSFRILHIATSGSLLLNTVTISNGHEVRGGGIYSSGTLTMTNTTITNNQVITTTNNTVGLGGGVYIGGGIFMANNCLIANNSAQGSPKVEEPGSFSIPAASPLLTLFWHITRPHRAEVEQSP